MPTINKRFLVRLLVGLAAAVGLLAGVHAVQAGRIPASLLAHADRAAEGKQPDKAFHYLRQYLEFRPSDAEALGRLARLLKDRPAGPTTELLLIYDKVLRLDPGREATRRDALDAALALRRFTDAAGHAEVLLQAHATDSELWQKRGAALAALQQPAEARKCFEAGVTHAPADHRPYQRLAQYLFRDLRSPAEAKQVIERMIAACPTVAEAYLTRARLTKATGGDPSADVRKALELEPANADACLMRAEAQQKARQLADARDTLAAGLKAHPDDGRLIRALAWLELNRGQVGAAVACLEDGLTRVPDGTDLLVPLADLLVDLGDTDRTAGILARLEGRKTEVARLQVKYLKGRLAMRSTDWAEAAKLFTELRTEAAHLPGLEAQCTLLFAVCKQRQGDTAAEHDALRVLLNKDPNHLTGRTTLALSLLNAGRPAEAIREYESAVQNPLAGPGVHAALARLKARELARGGGQPGDWPHLDRIARELERQTPAGSADAVLLRADLLAARGEYDKAAAVLQDEASRRPGDRRVWAALTDAVVKVAGVAAGLGVLDQAQAIAGDGPEVRLARADLTARDPARLRPLDPLLDQTDTWPEADQVKLLYGMVEAFDRVGDDAKAAAVCKSIAARRPADSSVWLTLAERATQVKDAKLADEAIAAAAKLDPTGRPAALLAAWRNQPGAINGLKKAFGPNPDRGDACVAMGKLLIAAGDASGIRFLDRAVRLDPTRFGPAVAYLSAVNDPTAFLDRLSRDHRWAGEPLRRAVAGAARKLPADRAQRLLTAAKPFVEGEPGGLGWLSDALLACGLRQPAAEVSEKAVEHRLATADDWLRLALRTADVGGDAGRVFAAAKPKLKPALFFAAAASFTESPAGANWSPPLDTPADRRGYTQARLAVQLSRFRRNEAVAMLTKFVQAQPPAADAVWAKRNLAMLYAVRGGPNDRANAMALLNESTDVPGESADEKRSSAAVLTALSRHLDGPDRKAALTRAIKLLQQLVGETRSARDAFLLAQLYRANGDRAASVQVLNGMLQADPRNLDYLVMALEELTERGEFVAAEPFAQRLLTLHPTEFRAVAAAARFECQAGRADKALALAEGYVRTADATAGDLPARSARAAELLDELARLPKVKGTPAGKAMVQSAVDKFAELATSRPEAVVAAAGLLAADGRHAEAFALLDKHPALPAPLRAAAGLAVVRQPGGGDRQRDKVAGWLEAAAAEAPTAASVQVNRGEFFALTQQYPQAEAAYRAALKLDPKNVVALNNLAWVLAPDPDRTAEALDLVSRAVAEVGLTGELLDTRGRIRIAGRKLDLAEQDITDALTQDRTGLRLFHLAQLRLADTPPKTAEAREAFRQAKAKGLNPTAVHPADLPAYKALDGGS
jgi:tetratricopeptide (TPR) repeat protein